MSSPTNTEVADVLEMALNLMNDSGAHWTQGTYETSHASTSERQYCPVGAINKIVGRDNRYAAYDKQSKVPLREAALEALAKGLRNNASATSPWDKITTWNDAERRRWPDIVARFTKTIERLRAS